MKITVDYDDSLTDLDLLRIKSAQYLSDFVLRIKFNDGEEKLVDFKLFLNNTSHPAIKKYLDEDKFASFSLIEGNLNWNNYEMIFPISDLYAGKIGS